MAYKALLFYSQAFHKSQLVKGPMNLFHMIEGEILPRGLFRNHRGLLMRGALFNTLSHDDQLIVALGISFIVNHIVTARIVLGNIQGNGPKVWWATLCEMAALGMISFLRQVNQRVVYVRTNGKSTTDQILIQVYHKFKRSTIFYQC